MTRYLAPSLSLCLISTYSQEECVKHEPIGHDHNSRKKTKLSNRLKVDTEPDNTQDTKIR